MGVKKLEIDASGKVGSLQHTINLRMMKKNMDQNTDTATQLLDSMQKTNAKIMESSVTPYKGGSIDAKV